MSCSSSTPNPVAKCLVIYVIYNKITAKRAGWKLSARENAVVELEIVSEGKRGLGGVAYVRARGDLEIPIL